MDAHEAPATQFQILRAPYISNMVEAVLGANESKQYEMINDLNRAISVSSFLFQSSFIQQHTIFLVTFINDLCLIQS
jgi:hypothetical protein